MKIITATHFKLGLPRLFLTLCFCAAAVVAKAGEPGPEADGVYNCGETGWYETKKKETIFRIIPKYNEDVRLELKGRTYRDYRTGDAVEKRGEFLPFTIDDKHRIEWSGRLGFLSHVGSSKESTYYFENGKAEIRINYVDHKRNNVIMVCRQETAKTESPKETKKESPKESPNEKK